MTLEQLGWSPAWAQALEDHRRIAGTQTPLAAGRVARQDRGSYVTYCDRRAVRADVAGALRNRAQAEEDWPAVGDWVLLRVPTGPGRAVIESILPRRSLLTRRAAGSRPKRQAIAANLDTLLICCGLDHDFNPRRIERYLTLAYAHHITPIVLLTKADLCAYTQARREEIQSLAADVAVEALDTRDPDSARQLRARIPAGTTAALVGSSGVGKSSLINSLMGGAVLATGEVRAHDGRGRHTTTFRQLLLVPGAGVVIDTPGMRELGLVGDEGGLLDSFKDIAILAGQCRFGDCTHTHEPGCRVQSAVRSGELSVERLESLQKQRRELEFEQRKEDPALSAAHRAKSKVIHKAARKHMRDKYRDD